MITLKNVNKSFKDNRILKNISVDFRENEITFIVGASGSGKTTLLNLIGGLDKIDDDSNSEILFNEKNIYVDLDKYRAKNIGFIFQDYNLISGLSITQNVNLGLYYCDKQSEVDSVSNNLHKLGLEKVNQTVETLSGGEKQRVAISRAILKEAKIILADEPTGNLDSKNSNNVFQILTKLKKNRHIIVVTHDLDKAKKYADRIITLGDAEIISDESNLKDTDSNSLIEVEQKKNNQIKRIKNGFWKTIFLLGINSVKKRVGRILSIALVLALSISSLATVVNLNVFGNQISKNVNINYLETDLLELFHDSNPNVNYKELPFNDDKAEEIKRNYGGNEIVKTYYHSFENLLFSSDFLTHKANLKQININEFFNERVMSNNIDGNFISADDEIIIASDVAETLFEGDYKNKVVQLNNGYGQHIELKVIGVNSTMNPKDQIYSFVSANALKKLYENYLSDSLCVISLEIDKVRQEITHGMTSGGIKPNFKMIDSSENILYGRVPITKNEILLGHKEVVNIFRLLNIGKSYTEQEILSGGITTDDLNMLMQSKLKFTYNDYYEVNIVGIYESTEYEVRLNQSILSEMVIAKSNILELYVNDVSILEKTISNIKDNENIIVKSNFKSLKENISSQTKYFEVALLVVGIIMSIISLVMINSFVKICVLERKNEIAILKSLGASNKNIVFLIWFDFAVIMLISALLSIVFSLLLTLTLPLMISNLSYIKIEFPFLLLGLIWILFVLLIMVYSLLNLRKFVKMMPAELLKKA